VWQSFSLEIFDLICESVSAEVTALPAGAADDMLQDTFPIAVSFQQIYGIPAICASKNCHPAIK